MAKLIHRAGSCENGPCPNVFDVVGDGLEDMIAIQGAKFIDPNALAQLSQMPSHEGLILFPRQLILEYADRIRREETAVDA
jgi:hypothetical protein